MRNALTQRNRFFFQPTFFANGKIGGLVLLRLFCGGSPGRRRWHAARASLKRSPRRFCFGKEGSRLLGEVFKRAFYMEKAF